MILYTFECACGMRFDDYAEMNEPIKQAVCPLCKAKADRVFTPIHMRPYPGTMSYEKMFGFLPGTSGTGPQKYKKNILDQSSFADRQATDCDSI